MREMLVPVLVALLALTACADSPESASTTDEVAPTTTAPTTTAPTTTAPTTTALADPGDSEYCRITLASDELDDDLATLGDPAALETFLVEMNDLLDQATAVAPPEIAADLIVMNVQLDAVALAAAEGDYAFSALASAILETETPETEAASAAVDAYDERVCGAETETEPDDTDSDDDNNDDTDDDPSRAPELTVESFEVARSSEATRDQLIEGFTSSKGFTQQQGACFIDQVSPELFVALGTDTDPDDEQLIELLELLEACDIPATSLSS